MPPKSALPRICVAATGRTPGELCERAEAALQHARRVELRLDWVAHPQEVLPLIPGLLSSGAARTRRKNAVLQATCRRQQNGGRFCGPVSEQMEVLRKAAQAGCRVLDVEIESAEETGPEALAELRKRALLILSFHDFQATPRLKTVARRLRRFPSDYYKVVTTATRQSDNCAILDFLSAMVETTDHTGESAGWIAFCMGEMGVPSRVLALSRGSSLVYAAHSDAPLAELAAPGLIAWDVLRDGYRAERLSPKSALYGLLGCPIKHSVGAAIHNAAFRAEGLDAVYVPLLAADLKDFRAAAKQYPLAGFSITIPHKRKMLRLVDRADSIVRATGAANTVRVRKGRWEATNTDVAGIAGPLRKAFRLSEGESLPADFRALVVGAGGAARAALYALRQLRCRNLAVAGRNPAKVRLLVRQLGGRSIPVEALEREAFDLLIHATSVGMWPRCDECFLRPEQMNAGTVFDLVYNPPETRLLQIAKARGCRTISGLEMFLAQAARQFEYWTRREAPLRWMRQTAIRELSRLRDQKGEAG